MTETLPGRKNSILRRIMMMSWLVAAMSVFIFAGFMVYSQRGSLHRELHSRAKTIALGIEDEIATAIKDRDGTNIVIFCLKQLEKNQDAEYIVVTYRDGYSIICDFNQRFSEAEGMKGIWLPTLQDEDKSRIVASGLPGLGSTESLHYTRACSVDGISAAHIHVGMNLDSYEANVRTVYITTGLVVMLTLVIGALASWYFARNFTNPIKSLQAFAYKVATGALHARAPVTSNDEVGDLALSINRMVESLEQNQIKIRESLKTEASAREKEILLREIHHRVKNNMQILTSLLRLQTRRANSEEMKSVLQESEARIRSMGLLHEKLYQSESVSVIDLQGYLRSLTNELLRMNTPPGKRREIKLSVRDVQLGLDTALPVGLMVTELVSNALKYAFPEQAEGIIYISISKEGDDYVMIVWDNGVGIPDDFDVSKSQSLGMRLVTMLTDQLNGKVSFSGAQGTRWEIRFKETQYKVRL